MEVICKNAKNCDHNNCDHKSKHQKNGNCIMWLLWGRIQTFTKSIIKITNNCSLLTPSVYIWILWSGFIEPNFI